jgi:hypothetical protein
VAELQTKWGRIQKDTRRLPIEADSRWISFHFGGVWCTGHYRLCKKGKVFSAAPHRIVHFSFICLNNKMYSKEFILRRLNFAQVDIKLHGTHAQLLEMSGLPLVSL